MSLKNFLKPTKGKIILFAAMFLIYAIFDLIPTLTVYPLLLEMNQEGKSLLEGISPDLSSLPTPVLTPLQLAGATSAIIMGIYLLSCALIAVKNKIKK